MSNNKDCIWTQETLEYNYNETVCRCGILVIGTTVIATELREGNPGYSITNSAEAAAAAVCNQRGIEPAHLIWIEHYVPKGRMQETFDRTLFSGFRMDDEGHVSYEGVSVDWVPIQPDKMHKWLAKVFSGPPLLK